MIKFEACMGKIQTIEVAKETDKTITTPKGNRRFKDNSWCPIFDTWQQAHEWLMCKAVERMELAQRQLKYAEENYNDIIKLKEK